MSTCSYHSSIPEAITTATSLKQLKLLLLVLLAITSLYLTFRTEIITVKNNLSPDILLLSGNSLSESEMTSMGLYYSVRYGNISSNSMKSIEKILPKMLPFSSREDTKEYIEELKTVYEDTEVTERFVPTRVSVHKQMSKVWVTGTRYIYVQQNKPKIAQVTKVYEFKIKRGFAYPAHSEIQIGAGNAQREISAYLEQEN
ncbi:TraE/TraK family type IV conjugative transfer system protein [Pseudoalteromonas sp. T1lg23B]|uniref:TraE/TraK family type IV conjugative transfer system protein n=1 Tax=Pseudoalteromonas sp. T1lg23B TaxID=2077097 RepID=UPI000CF6226F|nr:TraE/TraK family type IV conjugative transfer system protein [Pseudoalteromonas sp. T1lg23B]